MATDTRPLFRAEPSEAERLRLRLSRQGALTVVAAAVVIVPLLGGPHPPLPWDGASGLALQLGALLLLAVALWRAEGRGSVARILRFAGRGPHPWLLGLMAWGLASWAASAGATAALQGALQLGSGLIVYACVAYRTRRGGDYRLLLDALAAVTLLLSLVGIAGSARSGAVAFGGLFNHRLFGAYLMLTVPVLLAYSWSPLRPARRLMAQGAAGLGLLGLLAAHWTPALRGEGLALLLVGLLGWRLGLLPRRNTATPAPTPAVRPSSSRTRRSRDRQRSAPPVTLDRRLIGQWALYGLIGVLSVTLFLSLTPRGVVVLRHTRTALAAGTAGTGHLLRHLAASARGGQGAGEETGRRTGAAVLAMIRARPVRGWGIGNFAVYQQRFTHQGDDPGVVRRSGPRMIDRPQSFYLQLAAELGLPGLALWAGALVSFFAAGAKSLRRTGGDPLRRLVLVGCLAAVAGQALDAFTDAAWQFGAVSLFLWVVLGLGVAAAGSNAGHSTEAPAAEAAPRVGSVTSARVAAVCLVSAVFLALIVRVAG